MSTDSVNSFDYLPYFAQGEVVKGFGRGGAELGIPTANFPNEVVQKFPQDFVCGVYYGWACLDTLNPSSVYKMVMCVGWNTHFNNTLKTVETHIMHKFDNDFYHENLRIIILGYIRPMKAFNSIDELIEAMNGDIQQATQALDQPSMLEFNRHTVLISPDIHESVISRLPSPSTTTVPPHRKDCIVVTNSKPLQTNQTVSSPIQINGQHAGTSQIVLISTQTNGQHEGKTTFSEHEQNDEVNCDGLSESTSGAKTISNVNVIAKDCDIKHKNNIESVESIRNGHCR